MEFLKKHYEKILLSVILVGLAAAAAYLPIKIKQNKAEIESVQGPVQPPPGGAPAVPSAALTNYTSVLTTNAFNVQLTAPHYLFNPVPWKRTPDGRLIKVRTGNELGIGALRVVKIEPLRLAVSFEGVSGTGEGRRFIIGLTREADSSKNARRKSNRFVSIGQGSRTDPFVVMGSVGGDDVPTGVEVVIVDTRERVTVTKEKPYTRIDGFQADLRYPPEAKNFPDRRQMSQSTNPREYQVEFGGEKYNIVAITEKDVTVSAVSTSKRTVIPYQVPKT